MRRFGSGRSGAVRCFARGSGEGSGSGSGNKVLEKKVCGRRKVAGKVAGRGGFLEGKVPDKVPENIGKGSERGVGSLVPFGRLCFHGMPSANFFECHMFNDFYVQIEQLYNKLKVFEGPWLNSLWLRFSSQG